MTAQFIVSLALLVVALGILIVALVKTIGAEDRSQRTYERPKEAFKYHHGRSYEYKKGLAGKERAFDREVEKRAQADQRVVKIAEARRKAAP